ncbi:MAG: GNAT family protein [Lachnospiraceae bacterium]
MHSKAEYGIFIGDDCARSKGIGNEAGKAMVEYAFRELRLHKIYLRVLAENEIARRSYRTLGFEEEAYLKQDVRINGTYYDIVRMACFNTYTR